MTLSLNTLVASKTGYPKAWHPKDSKQCFIPLKEWIPENIKAWEILDILSPNLCYENEVYKLVEGLKQEKQKQQYVQLKLF